MNCVICINGETRPGWATVTLNRRETTVVIRRVPAMVCDQCGEEYLDAGVAASLDATVVSAAGRGVRFAVQEYAAA